MSRRRNDGTGLVILFGLLFLISVGVTYIYFRHLFRRSTLSIYSKIVTFISFVVTYAFLFNIVRSVFDYNESTLSFIFVIYLIALLAVPVCLAVEAICWTIEKIHEIMTMKEFFNAFIVFLEESRQEAAKTYAKIPKPILEYLISEPYSLEYPGYAEAKKYIANLQYDFASRIDILEFVSEHPETSLDAVVGLYERNLLLGMSQEEVAFLRGDPDDIDQEEVTANHHKIRFVYGSVRGQKDYIYFKDGFVTKIQGATL